MISQTLVEENMHPDPDTGIFRPFLLSKSDTRFLPHHLCQSPTRRPTKIYVPTVARYITALVAQIHQKRLRLTHRLWTCDRC
jgi:hypothetical protein